MKQYQDMLRHVITNGTLEPNRTGTSSYSVFGYQFRHDMRLGFPLLTTKKMFTKGMIEELLWFIRGSISVTELQNKGVYFWDSWVDEDNSIGPGYGKQMRDIEYIGAVKRKLFDPPDITPRSDRTVFDVGYTGAFDESDPMTDHLRNTWREMIRRCYYEPAKSFGAYGGKGVHVDERWHCFANFQQDAKKIPGWELKWEYPDEYSIDKDVLFGSNRYGPKTCVWASHKVQSGNTSTNRFFRAYDEAGIEHVFTSVGEANREHGLNISAVHRCLNGSLKTHHGWKNFTYLECGNDEVFRYNHIDQLKAVVAMIKHNPNSRRNIISLWNPHEIDRVTLPPCHGNIIQFRVYDNKWLDLHMYQRSADIFLGVPVNIASYGLLLDMLAQVTGKKARSLITSYGDLHLYENHLEQAKIQLDRRPMTPPTLVLNPDIKNIDDFKFDDIKIVGYSSHPALKGDVAV